MKIDGGTIEGAVLGDVLSFKGIPYAAPPVGNLRWRASQAVKSWKGVRKATEYDNDCPQTHSADDASASSARTGDPNGGGLPQWPKFDPARFDLMDFTNDNGPVFGPEPRPVVALVERAAEGQTSSQNASTNIGNLGGTSWQLVKFQGSDDRTLTPDDKSKYVRSYVIKDGHLFLSLMADGGAYEFEPAR